MVLDGVTAKLSLVRLQVRTKNWITPAHPAGFTAPHRLALLALRRRNSVDSYMQGAIAPRSKPGSLPDGTTSQARAFNPTFLVRGYSTRTSAANGAASLIHTPPF